MAAALLASVEHSGFCLDLREPWQVPSEEQLLFCPEERTRKLKGLPRPSSIHWGQGQTSTIGGPRTHRGDVALLRDIGWGMRQIHMLFRVLISARSLILEHLHASRMVFPYVRASASVYSCFYWWQISLRRKAYGSEFKFRFHFDDAVCLVRPQSGQDTEEELLCKDQMNPVEDW